MKFEKKITGAILAGALMLTGCTSGFAGGSLQSSDQTISTPEAPTLTPEQQYDQDWARIKSNLSVNVNCDNYAYTGSTYGTITNNNSEDLTISVVIAYLHQDGSIAGEVTAQYVDVLANTSQKVQFSDPDHGFSYSTCKVIKIIDERFGND